MASQDTLEALYTHVDACGGPLTIGDLFPNMPHAGVYEVQRRNHGAPHAGRIALASFRTVDRPSPSSLYPTVTISGMTFDNPYALFANGKDEPPNYAGAARIDFTYGLHSTAAFTVVHARATALLPPVSDAGTLDTVTWSAAGTWVNIMKPFTEGPRTKPGTIDRFALPLLHDSPEVDTIMSQREPFDPLLLPLTQARGEGVTALEHAQTSGHFLGVVLGILQNPAKYLAERPHLSDKDIAVIDNVTRR